MMLIRLARLFRTVTTEFKEWLPSRSCCSTLARLKVWPKPASRWFISEFRDLLLLIKIEEEVFKDNKVGNPKLSIVAWSEGGGGRGNCQKCMVCGLGRWYVRVCVGLGKGLGISECVLVCACVCESW